MVRWAWAACAWCLVFAVPHVYWALGGRAGLGAEAAALATPWFAAYNAATTVLALAGAALTAAYALGRPRWRPLLLVGGLALLARGAIGAVGLAVAAFSGGITSPPVLVAIEPLFLLGGVLLLGLHRVSRTPDPSTARPRRRPARGR